MPCDWHNGNANGATPLHAAAWAGHAECALLLIKAGTRLDAKVKWGSTPLHFACERGKHEVARALLRAGCDPNARADDGATPLITAAREGRDKCVEALLQLSTVEVDTAAKFLQKTGAPPAARTRRLPA